ncbi:MAG: hypothetical protein GZ093_15050 [Rhodoferax sp.]|uniref:hypothetical protein n=1 Tax=Rhodoferax sp. TaxID=50421 RepID=UPI001401242B|nr:hypothetical protein [Rhodoferax sp.]NDP40045.1 hypothetical protein [Rhodoferax sp.]
MIHPLFLLIATRPQLLADHAEAYAELVATEVGHVSTTWKRRALLYAVALGCLAVGAVLAGVALMLWAVIPVASMHAPWVLFAAPVVPMVLALWCLLAARSPGDSSGFDTIRQQMKADLAMLREASTS